ncbi:MAG: hypothetical protein LBD03_06270, partial [Methanobrevibacter sp.]|nr:hypothetical protein [Candidatus Methanovirga procula]
MFLNTFKKTNIIIFSLFLMVCSVHGVSFSGFNHGNWLYSQHGFNEVVINPTNGTIADALKISDYVLLMPGTYTGDGNVNINISGNKHIRATDLETAIIDGKGEIKLFNVEKNSILNLTNLVLTGGNDSTGNGGAIFSNGTLNLEGCVVQDNTATTGGSIYINTNNTFSFINTKILNNRGTLGAGVYIDGCNGVVKNTTFENNGNLDPNIYVFGSGLFIVKNFDINITDSIFNGNKGGFGGGLEIMGSPDDMSSKAVISNSVFRDNEEIASGAGMSCTYANVSILNSKFYNNKIDEKYDIYKYSNGAGVYTAYCNLNIKNSEFRNNSGLYGSGLCNENGTNTSIEDCNFTDNVARGYGAGMVVLDGNLDVKNTKFMNNSANMDTSIDDNNGGGIYFFNGNIKIDNSTFKTNHAHHGGGLDTRFANVNIKNSLFDSNNAVYGGGVYSREGTINMSNSALSNNTVSMNGGGIYNLNGSTTIEKCNITSNVAVDNGG